MPPNRSFKYGPLLTQENLELENLAQQQRTLDDPSTMEVKEANNVETSADHNDHLLLVPRPSSHPHDPLVWRFSPKVYLFAPLPTKELTIDF